MSNPLGLNVPSNEPTRSVIGDVDTSPSGNVVVRVGHTLSDSPGWEQTEHVVLDRDEAQALIERLQQALGAPAAIFGGIDPEQVVSVIYNKPGEEGAVYTLRRGDDGREAVLGDSEDGYWAIANALDNAAYDAPVGNLRGVS